MIKSHPSILEITVVSAQGIKNTPSLFFSTPPRPFVTITSDVSKSCHVYRTRVDEEGGVNPTWSDTFQIPLEPTLFTAGHSSGLCLTLFTKRAFLGRGPAQIGWCNIPSTDILDGTSTVGQIRNLSYRIRAKDGSRGDGVVNVAVRLMGSVTGLTRPERPLTFVGTGPVNPGRTVIGIPITHFHNSLVKMPYFYKNSKKQGWRTRTRSENAGEGRWRTAMDGDTDND